MNLSEKEQYYMYAERSWAYKQPPVLDKEIVDAITRIGKDQLDDPLYRFTWGGVAVVRTDPDSDGGEVRGDRAACVTPKGRLTPRYRFVSARQPKALCFKTDSGHTVRTTRLEFVPPGRLSWWEYEYVDYGILRWFLERKLSAEELVDIGMYKPDDPELPSRGDYICILRLENKGLYLEPTLDWIDAVMSHQWEGENIKPDDLIRADRDARDKAHEQQEFCDDIDTRVEFYEATDDIMEGKAKVDYFFPTPAGVRLLPPTKFDPKLREKVVNAITQESVPHD